MVLRQANTSCALTTRSLSYSLIPTKLCPLNVPPDRQVEATIRHYISGCLKRDSRPGERQRVYSEMRQAKEMFFTHMSRVDPEAYVQVGAVDRAGVQLYQELICLISQLALSYPWRCVG